jgi:hypothetical protein
MNPQSAIRNPQSADGLPSPPDGWLPIAIAARVLSRSASAIRSQCQAGRLPAMLCRGVYGAEWFIDPASVPALRLASGDVATPAIVGDPLAGLTGAKRRKIYEQFLLVQAWEKDLAAKPPLIRADRWMASWCKAQRGLGRKLCPATLYRWQAKIDRGGIAALADRRGGVCASNWTPEALSFIVGQYIDESRPSISLCFERAEAVAASQGWTLPSRATVRRHIRRHIDPKLIACGREGKKFRDRCLPDIRRDWSLVSAMELWVADHRQLDVWVPRRVLVDELASGRKTGRKCWRWSWFRPWLTMFLDAATWYPVAWDLRFETPDANQVMSVFCRAVQLWGKPAHAYLDNGKDFRARRFAGGRRRKKQLTVDNGQLTTGAESSLSTVNCQLPTVTPILEMLGIGVTWALPYNAKAKVIEPWFRLMSERFDRTFETYLGNKPERRPERVKAMTGKAEQYYNDGLTIEAVSEAFTRWVQDDMVHRECPVECRKPLSTAEAFHKCRAADFIESRPPEQDLALLLMPSQRVVVSKNGIYVRHHDRLYWSDDLLDRAAASGRDTRRHIIYRYRTDDDSHIYVFDALTGKYLCSAEPFTGDRVHPIAAAGSPDADRVGAAMEMKNHFAKAFRSQARDLKRSSFDVLLSAQQAGARAGGRLTPATIPPGAPACPVCIQITPQISQAAAAAARDKVADDRRRSNRQSAEAFLATGTDAADAVRKSPPKTAIDILADAVEP